jgi:hypothetical protein
MEFTDNQIVIIAIVAGVIITLALVSVISSRRRKKQDEEMNTFSTYKNTSGPKTAPKSKPVETSNYKFSLETGEALDGDDSNNVITTTSTVSENDVMQKMEEKLSKMNISEKQKERFMQQVKMGLQQNHSEQTQTTVEKIEMIQKSNLSDAQKKKVIDSIKSRSLETPGEQKIDDIFDIFENKQ